MNKKWIGFGLFYALIANTVAQSHASDFDLLARKCAPWVATQTLAAIAETESAFNPFAIGVNGGYRLERQPRSKDEAVKRAKWFVANGYKVDLGLVQISIANLNALGFSIEDAFDPCQNLSIGAGILQDNYLLARTKMDDDQAALFAALSAYNTGSFTRGITNGYVRKVVRNAVKGSTSISRKVPNSTVAFSKNEIDANPSEENVYSMMDRSVMVY